MCGRIRLPLENILSESAKWIDWQRKTNVHTINSARPVDARRLHSALDVERWTFDVFFGLKEGWLSPV
jgi:hypothetical protein